MTPSSRQPFPALRRRLLDWYEREGRTLPWRVRPDDRARGARPDPYAVWLSEIMLQQTTVPHATPYFLRFLERWPTVSALALADRDEILAAWAGLGYYARARKLIDCAEIVAEGGGAFPSDEAELLALPGVGPYTAAAVRALAFDLPANVVDGNVERVISRLHALETPLPQSKAQIRVLAGELADPGRPGDYAQALMDLGATACTPRHPACDRCPWLEFCAAAKSGRAADFPRRAPRAAKPTRRGVAFIVERDGGVWLRRRPASGLLGGMLEVPSTPWRGETWPRAAAIEQAPFAADWEPRDGVKHVFTHFTLELQILRAVASPKWPPPAGGFHAREDLDGLALPSLMRKVLASGLA